MKCKGTYGAFIFFICMCMFKDSSSIAKLCNLTTYFIFKVYTAPKRVEQTLDTVDSSAETEKITKVKQVDSREDLSYKDIDIVCQPEETPEVYVEKKVAHDEQVFKPEDSLRKKSLSSTETVTKEEIPEIKAEPNIQMMQSETKKTSDLSGVVKEVKNLPDLVLKSDVSQTKPEFVDKVVAPKEAVSMKVIPKENDIKMKKEPKMPERGTLTNTYTCAFFGISTLFTHFIQSVLCLVLQCLLSRQAK